MILVIDVGTTSLRAAVVDDHGRVLDSIRQRTPPQSPAPGLVEFDPVVLADIAVETANALLARIGAVDALAIATQRASTVLWDRASGEPLGPGLGWQDLRTLGDCLALRAEHGLEMAPNQTATKARWLLAAAEAAGAQPGAQPCIGTVDSWLIHRLTEGRSHVTDHTNACVTGLYDAARGEWDDERCSLLGIEQSWLPRLVDTCGYLGDASVLDGAPPIVACAGDQQASMVGQGCVRPGIAKITFGTGAMLDMVVDPSTPTAASAASAVTRPLRSERGTFPIVAWKHLHHRRRAIEAIMLSAGTAVDWLCDDLGIITDPAESDAVAADCSDSDGVVYVPALLGLGTPHWDYGARGTLLGLTRGTRRSHIVRAVLEGIAHRGADLIDAARADAGSAIDIVRVDGGMSRNNTFVNALAAASGVVVEVSPEMEATTAGAGLLGSVALGSWAGIEETAAAWQPEIRVEPTHRLDRERWEAALERAGRWIPELSALDF